MPTVLSTIFISIGLTTLMLVMGSIVLIVLYNLGFQIKTYFEYPSLSRKLGFEYIGSWKNLISQGGSLPPYLHEGWLGNNSTSRIVKGKNPRHTVYIVHYRHMTFWNKNNPSFPLFVFNMPHKNFPVWSILPNRLFTRFKISGPFSVSSLIIRDLGQGKPTPQDIPFRFFKKYNVQIPRGEEPPISKWLTAEVMTLLLKRPYWNIGFDGCWLFVYLLPGLIFPVALEKQFEEATSIAKIMGFK